MTASADDILFSSISAQPTATSVLKNAANFKFVSRDDYENEDLEWQDNPQHGNYQMVLQWNGGLYDAIQDEDGHIEDNNYIFDDLQTFLEWRSCYDDVKPVGSPIDDDDKTIWISPSTKLCFVISDNYGTCPLSRIPDLVTFLLDA